MIVCPKCKGMAMPIMRDTSCGFYSPVPSPDWSYFTAKFTCKCGCTGTFYWDLNEKATVIDMEGSSEDTDQVS